MMSLQSFFKFKLYYYDLGVNFPVELQANESYSKNCQYLPGNHPTSSGLQYVQNTNYLL